MTKRKRSTSEAESPQEPGDFPQPSEPQPQTLPPQEDPPSEPEEDPREPAERPQEEPAIAERKNIAAPSRPGMVSYQAPPSRPI
jgi:hypothetical protein